MPWALGRTTYSRLRNRFALELASRAAVEQLEGRVLLSDSVTAYPTPLTAINPSGSLIYDPSTSGLINNPGDTDSFTVNLAAGQTISAVAHPVAAGLEPTLTAYG